MLELLTKSTFNKISTIKNYQDLFVCHLQDFKFLIDFVSNHTPKTSQGNLECANQQKKQNQSIQSVQEGALKFVSEFNNSSIADYINLDSKTMFAPLYQLGTQPTLKEAQRFGNLGFFDAGQVSFLAKPRSLLWYLGHLKILADDLNDSVWKIGYLKRLFKLNLNYARLYDYLYNIWQKLKKYMH